MSSEKTSLLELVLFATEHQRAREKVQAAQSALSVPADGLEFVFKYPVEGACRITIRLIGSVLHDQGGTRKMHAVLSDIAVSSNLECLNYILMCWSGVGADSGDGWRS